MFISGNCRLRIIVIIILFSMVLASCANQPNRFDSGHTGDGIERYSGSIVIADVKSPVDKDYFPLNFPWANDHQYRIEHLVFDGILYDQENGLFAPNLGFLRFNQDYNEATIELADRYWHDGEPITTDDIVFTYNFLLSNKDIGQFHNSLFHIDGATEVSSQMEETISGLQVIDSKRLLVRFNTVDIENILLFTYPILPKHVYGDMTKDNMHDLFLEKWIGSSLYKVESIGENEITLSKAIFNEEKKEKYYDEIHTIKPIKKDIINELVGNDVEEIIWRTYRPNQLNAALLNEEVDVFHTNDLFAEEQMNNIKNYDIVTNTGNMFFYLGFNLDSDNVGKEVRKMFQNKILVGQIHNQMGEYWGTAGPLYNSSHFLYNDNITTSMGSFAMDNANNNVVKTLNLIYVENATIAKVVEEVEIEARELGIQFDKQPVSFDEYLQRLYVKRDFDLFIGSKTYPVIHYQREWWSSKQLVTNNGFNTTGFVSRYQQELEEIHVDLLRYLTSEISRSDKDKEKLIELENKIKITYELLQQEVMEEAPYVIIGSPMDVSLVHHRTK